VVHSVAVHRHHAVDEDPEADPASLHMLVHAVQSADTLPIVLDRTGSVNPLLEGQSTERVVPRKQWEGTPSFADRKRGQSFLDRLPSEDIASASSSGPCTVRDTLPFDCIEAVGNIEHNKCFERVFAPYLFPEHLEPAMVEQ